MALAWSYKLTTLTQIVVGHHILTAKSSLMCMESCYSIHLQRHGTLKRSTLHRVQTLPTRREQYGLFNHNCQALSLLFRLSFFLHSPVSLCKGYLGAYCRFFQLPYYIMGSTCLQSLSIPNTMTNYQKWNPVKWLLQRYLNPSVQSNFHHLATIALNPKHKLTKRILAMGWLIVPPPQEKTTYQSHASWVFSNSLCKSSDTIIGYLEV